MLKKIFIVVISLLVICFLISLYFFYSVVNPCPSLKGVKEFIIDKGDGVNQISQKLKKEGFICSRLVFENYVWLIGKKNQFKAGRHFLPRDVNIRHLVNLLTSGQSLTNELTIKVLEGWTIDEIAEYLAKQKIVKKEDFLNAVKLPDDFHFDFLKEINSQNKTLEGYLFPDTYRIYQTATAQDIIKKMITNFDQKLNRELREEIKKQGKSISQIVVMASILEKEAGSDEDRAMIADIFWRRLKKGIGIQADSTVNYITGKKTPSISYEDAQIDSLYNTYKYRGLPPGAICNPGLSSIKAAIYPKANDYWYFLSTKDGKIIYSKNLEEHNLNKVEYLK
ncbi:MAG: endolytic transglycosylase MltG [bacterium]